MVVDDRAETFSKKLHPNDYIPWDTRQVTDETVEYLHAGQVVFTRLRCPVINTKKNKGQRCESSVGPGHMVCWNHRPRE